MSEPTFHANTITFAVSREMALDFGLVEPTPEEAAERAARTARWEGWRARHRAQQATMVAALNETGDAVTTAILALHSSNGSEYPECQGCDFSGAESEPPEWPCRTVLELARAHGIPEPEPYSL